MNEAETIRNTITMREVADRFGLEVNNKGFCHCPFHSGDNTPSMKIYDGKGGFCCYGCGAKGSVIDFVMLAEKVNFRAAVKRLDYIFNLGLFNQHKTAAEKEAERNAVKEAMRLRRENEIKREYTEIARNALTEYRRRLFLDYPDRPDCQLQVKFLDELLDKYLNRNSIIEFDFRAHINYINIKLFGEVKY